MQGNFGRFPQTHYSAPYRDSHSSPCLRDCPARVSPHFSTIHSCDACRVACCRPSCKPFLREGEGNILCHDNDHMIALFVKPIGKTHFFANFVNTGESISCILVPWTFVNTRDIVSPGIQKFQVLLLRCHSFVAKEFGCVFPAYSPSHVKALG
jgi:hypothetical protein